MQQFDISTASGESVTVEADNWMSAMGRGIGLLSMDPTDMVQWVCRATEEGVVVIDDPVTGARWTVTPRVPSLRVVASGPQAGDVDVSEEVDTEELPDLPGPQLHMPASSLQPLEVASLDSVFTTGSELQPLTYTEEISQNLSERLFDLSADMVGGDPADAAQMALEIIGDFVPAEASSVATGTINDLHLTFVAATGPVSADITGQQVPLGAGLVGLCFDLGIPLRVIDVRRDDRHLRTFDEATGFDTRMVICVPVANEYGTVGVLQVINPERAVSSDDVDVVIQVATTLANASMQT